MARLEMAFEEIKKGVDQVSLAKDVIQECMKHPNQVLLNFIEKQVVQHKESLVPLTSSNFGEQEIEVKIQAYIREEKERQARGANMRIGGLSKEWIDEYTTQGGTHYKFQKYFMDTHGILFPEITGLSIVGNQILMSFGSKIYWNLVLQQAKNLKGSRIWFAEDLTKAQLSQKRVELQKVRQARKEGLWARYQDGTAVIRKFRTANPEVEEVAGDIVAPEDPNEWNSQEERIWLEFRYLDMFSMNGSGTIDGRGQQWWSCVKTSCNGHPSRSPPALLTITESTNVEVENICFTNSQKMHVVIYGCNGVRINNLHVTAPSKSPNTDGIHFQKSTNVLIQNCAIATGDDCISIGNGSANLVIRNIMCGPGHGISIGSLGEHHAKATISNVFVDSVTLSNTTYGLRIKTWQGGLGSARYITFQNIDMCSVRYPILINQYYCPTGNCHNETSAVQVSHVSYRNIKGTSITKEAIKFACSDTVPCTNLFLENINLTYALNGKSVCFSEGARGSTSGAMNPTGCFN